METGSLILCVYCGGVFIASIFPTVLSGAKDSWFFFFLLINTITILVLSACLWFLFLSLLGDNQPQDPTDHWILENQIAFVSILLSTLLSAVAMIILKRFTKEKFHSQT
jgi:Na+-driven multidrug efflux pump